MLDRAGGSNGLFRFSTTDLQWEQLDATRVSGSPPTAIFNYGFGSNSMVSVGSDIYVFGESLAGEEGLCDDGHRLGAFQIERLGHAPRAAVVTVAICCARAGCHAVPHQGLVTPDDTSPVSWHCESRRGAYISSEHIHIERQTVQRGPCRGWYSHEN
jgi:hypothetical protein